MTRTKECSLDALNDVERLAREYWRKTGTRLPYEKYLFLLRHGNHLPTLETLLSEQSEREQHEIYRAFLETADQRDSLFSLENEDAVAISIERIPRYVETLMHSHDYPEFSYVLRGSCRHTVEGKAFIQEAGQLFYVNSLSHHKLVAEEDSICFTINIKREFLINMQLPNTTAFVESIMFQCGDDVFLRNTMLALWEQWAEEKPLQDRMLKLLLESFLIYILQNYSYTKQRLSIIQSYDKRLTEILNYIMENYQTITLGSLAGYFHYSESYMSILLHKSFGKTFSEIIREYRLEQAARLLRETKKKLYDVCVEVGYNDTTQFIHNFKKRYGITPHQYQMKMNGTGKHNSSS